MHPDIIHVIAAEQGRSLQERAAAYRRTAEIRRSRRTRPFLRLVRAGSRLRPRVA